MEKESVFVSALATEMLRERVINMSDFLLVIDISDTLGSYKGNLTVASMSRKLNESRLVVNRRVLKLESMNVLRRVGREIYINPTFLFLGDLADNESAVSEYEKMFGSCGIKKESKNGQDNQVAN